MAIKFVKGGLKEGINRPELPNVKPEESTSQSIIRNIKRAPVTIAKLAGIPGDIYTGLTGDEAGSITSQDIESGIERLTGSEKGAFKPQGSTEEFIDMLVSDAPFLAASIFSGGASALPAIAKTVGSNIGIKGAQEAGFGLPGQILGSVLGAKTPAKIKAVTDSFRKNPKAATKNLLQKAQVRSKSLYNQSNDLLKNKLANADELGKEMTNLAEDLTFIRNKQNFDAARDISQITKEIVQGKLPINIAKKYSQKYKYEAFNKNHKPEIKNAYKKAAYDVEKWIYGLEDEFGKGISDYRTAVDLTALNKRQEAFERVINKSSDLKKLFSENPWMIPTKLGTAASKKAILPISRAARFWKQPEVMEELQNTFRNLTVDADNEAKASLFKLAQRGNEFRLQNEQEAPKVKFIKGGLKTR